MEILKRLVRSHFEQTGKFGTTVFDDLLEEYSKNVGLSMEESYYNFLGYKVDSSFTAKERFTYSSLFLRGKFKALFNIFDVTNKVALIEKMKDLCVLPDTRIPLKNKPEFGEEYYPLIRLLSNYLTNNTEVALNVKEGTIEASSYIRKSRFITTKKQFLDLMQSEVVLQIIALSTPNLVVRDDCEGVIVKGSLFYKEELSKELLDKLMVESMAHAISAKLDVPLTVYMHVISNALFYHDGSDEEYKTMLDYATMLGITVKELFSLCGVEHVNHLSYFEKTKCIFYMKTMEDFSVYSINSVDPDQYIVLAQQTIEDLYKRDLLKTLNWENGRPFVYSGMKKFFSTKG